MNKIQWGRVVLGGLVAGLVINIGEFTLNEPVLGSEYQKWMEKLNVTPPGGSAIAVFVVMGFALGIAAVWLYAAIRPRRGPGPQTAVWAGAFVWALCYLYPNVGFAVLGFFPTRLLVIATVWGFFEIVLATLTGAWLYREP